MKQILILLYFLLLLTACNNGDSETSNSGVKSGVVSHVTVEFTKGQLKGTHVFNNNIKIKRYKEGTSDESGALIIRGAESENTGYFMSNYKKKFDGDIKVGSNPSSAISFPADGLAAALEIESRFKKLDWRNVHGKVPKQSDLTFTEVGEWSMTNNDSQVRRVKGSFSEVIELEYGNYAKILTTETVDMRVSFDVLEVRTP